MTPKRKDARREVRLQFTVTPEEFETISAQAEAAGLTVSSFSRKTIIESIHRYEARRRQTKILSGKDVGPYSEAIRDEPFLLSNPSMMKTFYLLGTPRALGAGEGDGGIRGLAQ